jgi:hypothetical protein
LFAGFRGACHGVIRNLARKKFAHNACGLRTLISR